MNLKWFSKNIKAVFAEEEEEEEEGEKGHPETTAGEEKRTPVLIAYFPWLAHGGPWSRNNSGGRHFDLKKIAGHPHRLLLAKIKSWSP